MEMFTTHYNRFTLKVNETFRLIIKIDKKGYCVWYIDFKCYSPFCNRWSCSCARISYGR
ncbi:hypothetical protein BN1317_40124 [Staphylococcus capitis]|nr:hypothetical protein CR01_10125 [Staphylococcus capitis CR01]CQD27044.1 hypothetical protein SCAPIOD150006 [Staphylococcus capitis]CUT96298.1 hypothetical protein BN1317_40124 [Staphylococcus capitis]